MGMPNITDKDLRKNMLKMGIRSSEGYIYFNEMLYRCMRRVYGQFKLNKQMQIFELKTQYKVLILQLAVQKKSRFIKNQTLLRNLVGKASSVNPFLTVMFYKTAFKAWLNYVHKVKLLGKKRREQALRQIRSSITRIGNMFDQLQDQQEEDLVYFPYLEDEYILLTDDDNAKEELSLEQSNRSMTDNESIREEMFKNEIRLEEIQKL